MEKIFNNLSGDRKLAADIRQNSMMVEIMRDDRMTLAAIELSIPDAKQLVKYLQEIISSHDRSRFCYE